MTENSRISVIITACGDSPALRACLERVREQGGPLDAESLLVINAEESVLSDESRAALQKRCDRILFEPRPGKSNALNSAVAQARGTVLAFTDDDATPAPGWLAAITAPLLASDRPPALVGCGGPVEPRFPDDTPGWYRELVDSRRTSFLGPRHDLGPLPCDYELDLHADTAVPLGANCAFRRDVFAHYGYDTRLGPNRQTGLRGGEDTLLGRQLLRDGLRLAYRPDAVVEHPVESGRTTIEYVRRGFFFNGLEWVRLIKIGGGELPPTWRMVRNLVRSELRIIRKRRSGRDDSVRRLGIKIAFERGMLTEIRKPFQPAPQPPRST